MLAQLSEIASSPWAAIMCYMLIFQVLIWYRHDYQWCATASRSVN